VRPPPADSMTGKRVDGKEPHELLSSEYGRWARDDGNWYARTPDGTQVANLGSHQVVEHEDGTITVSPSILVRGGCAPDWHGFLERGVWRLA
jgi:hypothetical protein